MRARDISRRGHSRDVRKVARRKLVPVMTTYLPAARRSLLRGYYRFGDDPGYDFSLVRRNFGICESLRDLRG